MCRCPRSKRGEEIADPKLELTCADGEVHGVEVDRRDSSIPGSIDVGVKRESVQRVPEWRGSGRLLLAAVASRLGPH